MTADSDAHQMAERLREIRERCEAAAPGPWIAGGDAVYTGVECGDSCTLHGHFVFADPDVRLADVAFIAHAREDVPFLLACITELEQEQK
jgi:hypothetical protein